MRYTVSLAVLAAALSTVSAVAQETASEIDDTIIVTGLRTESLLARTPASVDVIDREQMELRGQLTLVDALQASPGLSVVQSGPTGSTASVFVRGSNSKHVLALYDGIRLNDPATANGAFNFGSDLAGDAARIEVLRGPLSSLYGSDAVGGVINILPRRGPQEGSEAYGEASIGDFNTLRAMIGGGLSAGRLSLAGSAELQSSDGYDVTPDRFAGATGDADPSQISVVTANAQFALNEQFTLDALVRHRRSEIDFDTFAGGASFSIRADDPDLRSEDTQNVWAAGVSYHNPSDSFESRLRTGRVNTELDSYDDRSVTGTFEGDRDFVQWTNAWRPQGFDGVVDPLISFGVDWQDEDIRTDGAFNDPLERSEDAWSVFSALQVGFGQYFDITGSLRLDDYEAFGNETTYNLGAVYRVDTLNTRLRASYGTSFKAPTLTERFSTSNFVIANPDLEPEEGETFEIGFDSTIDLGGREDALHFGAVWYDSEIENLIEFVFNPSVGKSSNQNVGLADLQGYEAYVDWSPLDTASLRVDYTYTDAVNANTNIQLTRRPNHIWAVTGTWRPIDIASISASWRYVGDRLDVTYNDDGFFVSSSGAVPSYDVFDVTGVLDVREHIQLVLSARNLFDETYEPAAAFAGAPRAVTLGIRWRP